MGAKLSVAILMSALEFIILMLGTVDLIRQWDQLKRCLPTLLFYILSIMVCALLCYQNWIADYASNAQLIVWVIT